MQLNKLEIINFRNISEARIILGEKINLFIGDNGQGKTNILEAIYLFSTLRSFRTMKLEYLVKENQKETKIGGEFEIQNVESKIDILIDRTKKKAWFNGKPILKASQLNRFTIPFLFSNETMFSFNTFPSFRRRLIDRYLVQEKEGYLRILKESKRIMSNKQIELKEKADRAEIEPWNQLLAKNILNINQERQLFIDKINKKLITNIDQINNNIPKIKLNYHPNIQAKSEQGIFDFLTSKMGNEIKRKQILYGNQLDRLDFINENNGQKVILSSGQYKVTFYGLLLTIAEIYKEERNLLRFFLIDDILTDLEKRSANNLLESLKKTNAQIFITAISNKQLEDVPAKTFKVNQGNIIQ